MTKRIEQCSSRGTIHNDDLLFIGNSQDKVGEKYRLDNTTASELSSFIQDGLISTNVIEIIPGVTAGRLKKYPSFAQAIADLNIITAAASISGSSVTLSAAIGDSWVGASLRPLSGANQFECFEITACSGTAVTVAGNLTTAAGIPVEISQSLPVTRRGTLTQATGGTATITDDGMAADYWAGGILRIKNNGENDPLNETEYVITASTSGTITATGLPNFDSGSSVTYEIVHFRTTAPYIINMSGTVEEDVCIYDYISINGGSYPGTIIKGNAESKCTMQSQSFFSGYLECTLKKMNQTADYAYITDRCVIDVNRNDSSLNPTAGVFIIRDTIIVDIALPTLSKTPQIINCLVLGGKFGKINTWRTDYGDINESTNLGTGWVFTDHVYATDCEIFGGTLNFVTDNFDIQMHGGRFSLDLPIPAGKSFSFYGTDLSSDFDLSDASAGSLETYACSGYLSVTPADSPNWTNRGVFYSNRNSGLTATDTQTAIDELVKAAFTHNNLLEVIPSGQTVPGKTYTTWAAADAYLTGLDPVTPDEHGNTAPGSDNPWQIKIYGNNSEDIVLREFIHISGVYGSTVLTGTLTSANTLSSGNMRGNYTSIRECEIRSIGNTLSTLAMFYNCLIDIDGNTPSNGYFMFWNCLIRNGDFSGMASHIKIVRSEVTGGSFGMLWCQNTTFHEFEDNVNNGWTISGDGEFWNCTFQNSEYNSISADVDILCYGGFFDLPIVVNNTAKWSFSNTSFGGNVTATLNSTDTGRTALITRGCSIDDSERENTLPVTTAGAKWENSGLIYDNTTSGLTATDMQSAIDEIDSNLDSLQSAFNARTAAGISYDNVTSGLTATNVQAAVDEVDSNFDSLQSAFNARTAAGASYDNATSGLAATNVQTAIDEVVKAAFTHNNVIELIPGGQTIPGKVYTSWADIDTYINGLISGSDPNAPSSSNPWAVKVRSSCSDNISLLPYVHVIGDDVSINLTGTLTSYLTDMQAAFGTVIANCTITNIDFDAMTALGFVLTDCNVYNATARTSTTPVTCSFTGCTIYGGNYQNVNLRTYNNVVMGGTFHTMYFHHGMLSDQGGQSTNLYLHGPAKIINSSLDFTAAAPLATLKTAEIYNGLVDFPSTAVTLDAAADWKIINAHLYKLKTSLSAENQLKIKGCTVDSASDFAVTDNGYAWEFNGDYYDNRTSGLTATDTKGAIDELSVNITTKNAADTSYDNATSGLTSVNVQAAIDEISATLPENDQITTTDATVTTIFEQALAEGEMCSIKFRITADEDGTNHALYHREGLFYRHTGENVTQQGTTSDITVIESNAAWEAAFNCDTTNQKILIQVTGAATTITWKLEADVIKI